MYEEQIEGLAELILELMPDRTKENLVKRWVDGTVNGIVLAERKRAKEIVMSCLDRKLP
jgi:hypothetical protein